MDESDFEDLMKIQRMMARMVANETETDSKIKLMDIINELVTDKNKKVHKEAIILEAQVQGMSEAEIDRLLRSLKNDHMIEEPEEGFVRRA